MQANVKRPVRPACVDNLKPSKEGVFDAFTRLRSSLQVAG